MTRMRGQAMQYVRIYSDSTGESHFEDIAVPLTTVDFAPPAPPLHVSAFAPAAAYGFLSSPPGWHGDWHPTPRRQVLCYLAGTIEAETSDGEVRRFGSGSITLVEDTAGTGHRSQVIGEQAVVLVAIQLPD